LSCEYEALSSISSIEKQKEDKDIAKLAFTENRCINSFNLPLDFGLMKKLKLSKFSFVFIKHRSIPKVPDCCTLHKNGNFYIPYIKME
jgi:hypothetical protein